MTSFFAIAIFPAGDVTVDAPKPAVEFEDDYAFIRFSAEPMQKYSQPLMFATSLSGSMNA